MGTLSQLYGHSLGLLTDLYQLTMACGYWKSAVAEREAVFHLSFRSSPFGGEFAVAAGLGYVMDLLAELRFTGEDIEYLAGLRGSDGQPLFAAEFLRYLHQIRWRCDVDAIPEGTVVFPHEPLVRVRGPLLQCQLLETALLNLINFQTLVATKSARICAAASPDEVLEFGLRRAQGIDGGVAASRAAYVGGCSATSNVLAGKLFGIPVKGTHAHSWVMTFPDEEEAFRTYAAAQPNNCIFLVDTFDTLEGVRRAIHVGNWLKRQGHSMLGVRLDSGDLAQLSIAARRMLDAAGHVDAAIVASNDLDEFEITRLKQQGARINIWGVGTRLATAYDQPALGGVYKLSAIRDQHGWQHKIKLSEQPLKVSLPGRLQVRRYARHGRFIGDAIYDELDGSGQPRTLVDPGTGDESRLPPDAAAEDLLVPVFREGRAVYDPPSLQETRRRAASQRAALDEPITRLVEPQRYRVGLAPGLYARKRALMGERVHGE